MTRTNAVDFLKTSAILFIFASVLISTQGYVLEFTVEPSDTVVEAGQSAVLDCVVKASHHQSSILIYWLDQDGQAINFLTDSYRSQLANGSLFINNINTELEEQRLTGAYQCKAQLLDVGSIVSRIAKLSIASLSGFNEEPHDITVQLRQKAYFACYADAIPPPRIKWLKDERPLKIDELRMTVLPSGALEIDEVLESDQGSYRCNASGLNSYRLSNKANLIINGDHDQSVHTAAPKFIARPNSGVVIEGQNISLDCAANAKPTPSITWLKDGYAIDLNDLDSRFSLVGSTKTLRITNIQEQDAGTYQCRAENREDSLDASATIRVQVPPRFLTKPQDKVETLNKDVELECSVYGKPLPRVQWFRNGDVLTSNEYYKIVNGNNLKIMGLLTTDSGVFQCFATNEAGNIQASASLKVIEDRKSAQSKHRQKLSGVNKQQSMSLFSSLKSDNSGNLGEVDFGYLSPTKNYDISKTSIYDPHRTFSSLKSSESNDNINLGNTQSAFVPHPYSSTAATTQEKATQDLVPGPPQDFKSPMVKARFIILSWKPPLINGDNIQAYTVYYQEEGSKRERVQNTTRSKLEEMSIQGLIPSRVYHFRVVAVNTYGLGQSSKKLSVTTQPEEHVASASKQFDAYATSSHSIHISWRAPDNPNGIIVRYQIYFMETSTSIEHNVDTKETSYDLTSLAPYTEYTLWVVAVNHNGPGAATEEKSVFTFSDIPSEPPSNVTTEASSTSVVVRWEPPPVESQNGIITGYKLKYRKQGKKGNTFTTPANARHYEMKELERGFTYQIKMWAMNINGTGPGTEWIDISTLENDLDENHVPEKPAFIKVRATSDKLYIIWGPPVNQNIRVRNYIMGWGKGVPDMFSQELQEQSRHYIIDRLEANSEYVLSLRASNEVGAGPPIYTTVRTQDEPPPEPAAALMPPMGLKAQVLSTTSVVLYWNDPTLSKNQIVRDNRHYIVKYTAEKASKSKFLNVSDLNVMVDDLKPNTLYEFSVKLVKGRKESSWSMLVQNRTWELPPNVAPRDLDVHFKDEESQLVELTWQPPKIPGVRITGYVILFTDNKTKSEPEWQVLAIKGDNHSSFIFNLKPFTVYHFKVQARNSRGYGPFSNTVTFRTGQNVATSYNTGSQSESKGYFSGPVLLYIIVAGCVVALGTIICVGVFLCCRKKDVNTTTIERSKKGYQKGNQNIKPPDLWIHHDQMELKAMEKRHSTNDGASSSGAMTLPRSVGGNEYDNHEGVHTNSLDKRNCVPNYGDDKGKRPKKISLPVDSKPPREPIATPVNNPAMSQSSTDSTPSGRPTYPRTQYAMTRAHVSLDPPAPINQTIENVYTSHPTHPGYDASSANATYISQPAPSMPHVANAATYAPGMSILNDNQSAKRVQAQGHPLKSFTVPAPPPISAPTTPQPKHIVTVRPNTSPFKKPTTSSSSTLTSTPPSRISACNPPPHTAEEVQRLQPSHSTEELNQEMANLEGLMLTLNAITANEFEC